MVESKNVVSLFGVDDTLLDTARFVSDFAEYFASTFGRAARDRFWAILEHLHADRGYVDYLGALERFQPEQMDDPRVMRIASWLLDYPYSERLYPLALEVLQHAQRSGPAVLLCEGDAVFQSHKLNRAGLWEATGGRALICPHRDQELPQIECQYPAGRYVVIDHELCVLDAVKQFWGARATTVFVRKRRCSTATGSLSRYRPPDIAIDRIGQLFSYELSAIESFAREMKLDI